MPAAAHPMAPSSDSARGESQRDSGNDPSELAAEFLAERAAGESPAIEAFLARLGNEEERRELRELIDGGSRAARGLPRALVAGSRIASRYRITGELGFGGMGKVFAAHDEKLGRDVAVKVLAPLSEGNREREEMFDKEWRILADLHHPGIVAVHDAGNDGQFTYIVMDLVDGTAVSDVIERAARTLAAGGVARNGELLARSIGKPMSPGRRELIDPHDYARSVARIVLEIARTLEAAHGKKVIHRDLKPANVMLLGGGAPIVLDFGLAGSPEVRKSAASERLHGSLPYVAPEQAKSEKPGMDPRSDVYQIGLLLYEMLTLRRAFPGSAIGDVLQRIRVGYFEKPRKIERSIPRDLEAICMKALEVDLSRRYASAQALREDLEAWLEGRAPVASRDARWRSFVRTTRYTARGHPMVAAAAGMVLVGAAVWGGISAADPGPETRFFRMVEEGTDYRFHPIRERRRQVKAGDYIGFTPRSGGCVVYALSLYGPEGEPRKVSPWPASDTSNPGRVTQGKKAGEPWGFPVDRPEAQVICTRLATDGSVEDYEGVLVLVTPGPSDRLESWMTELDEKQGSTGIPWDEALRMLHEGPPRTRGSSRAKKPDVSQEQVENLIKRLHIAEAREARQLGLDGVDEFRIECRVTGK
jgi:tRNA A-37 threonylcarbamoyl transferase component Bud32